MNALKWVGIALVVILLYVFLRKGITAAGSYSASLRPSGWGSGMIYAPGSAWTQSYPYAYAPPYPSAYPPGYKSIHNLTVDYTPNDGATFGFQW